MTFHCQKWILKYVFELNYKKKSNPNANRILFYFISKFLKSSRSTGEDPPTLIIIKWWLS
jgi:hypothetical protein